MLAASQTATHPTALREAGIAYRCDINGDMPNDLTPFMQAVLYRLACETVAYINGQLICSGIKLKLRSGATNGVYWVALRVRSVLEDAPGNDAFYDLSERDYLASKLGAHGLGFVALRNHARLFDGDVREHKTSAGLSLTYLLIDATERPLQHMAAPSTVHPWVT